MENLNLTDNYSYISGVDRYLYKNEKILLTFPGKNFSKNKLNERAIFTDKRFIYLYNVDNDFDSSIKYLPINHIKGFSMENISNSHITISSFFIVLGLIFLIFFRNSIISMFLLIVGTLLMISAKKYVNIVILTEDDLKNSYNLKFNKANPEEMGNFIARASTIVNNVKGE